MLGSYKFRTYNQNAKYGLVVENKKQSWIPSEHQTNNSVNVAHSIMS